MSNGYKLNGGFIEADGTVHMQRGSRVVALKCPYTKGLEQCGDWCPHFKLIQFDTMVSINICHGGSLDFSKKHFEDRRK